MRKLSLLICAVALLCALSITASAETGASSVQLQATVSGDSSCQITLTAMLHLEQATPELTFPVPLEATNITLGGARAHTKRTDTAKEVDLSSLAGSMAGDVAVTISYMLDDVVGYNDDRLLQLHLPLLSGFSYPVQQLEFSVTLPGQPDASPAFSSGYHQSNIEKDLTYSVSGAVITGSSTKALKDHETLEMTLTVPEALFPQPVIALPDLETTNVLMLVSALLALVYYLLSLRCLPPRRLTVSAPPEGYSAGQLGSVLRLQGADLTLMVFTWAQLGYVRIRQDRRGHVMLYKRMDMGNERSSFEQRCFKGLFSRRSDAVDTAGYHYALHWQKVHKLQPGIGGLVHPKSGSVLIFRALVALLGLFGGAQLGITLGAGAVAQWLPMVLLAIFGAVSSYHMSRWAEDLPGREKSRLWTATVLGALWLLLGIFGGIVTTAVWVVLAHAAAGLMAAYGGRRTAEGRQVAAEVLGLRRYLRTVAPEQLDRITRTNPDYFYTMAPYALALGADRAFARAFGKQKLPDCPYLTSGAEQTAAQWNELLRRTAEAMDQRRKQLPREKIAGTLKSFMR